MTTYILFVIFIIICPLLFYLAIKDGKREAKDIIVTCKLTAYDKYAKKNTYEALCKCTNCGRRYFTDIPIGTPVNQAKCPRCNCFDTLVLASPHNEDRVFLLD